jgi:SAM-dependent methyltransferase
MLLSSIGSKKTPAAPQDAPAENFTLSDGTCPICAGSSHPCSEIGDKTLLICENCRHMHWREKPSPETISEYYRVNYGPDHNQLELQTGNSDYYRDHLQLLLSFMDRKDLHILDYGCSWPTLLIIARDMPEFTQVTGADYDAEACKYGQENGVQMLPPDALTGAIEPGSVDVVRFSHVIEHLIDPVGAISEVMGLLKPGGLIYITQPHFPTLLADAKPGHIKDSVWPEHLHFFNTGSVLNLLEPYDLEFLEFCAFQNEQSVYQNMRLNIDFAQSQHMAQPIKAVDPNTMTAMGSFPLYCGDNLHLIARKTS